MEDEEALETADLPDVWDGAPDGTRCCVGTGGLPAIREAEWGACRTGVKEDMAELGRSGNFLAAFL